MSGDVNALTLGQLWGRGLTVPFSCCRSSPCVRKRCEGGLICCKCGVCEADGALAIRAAKIKEMDDVVWSDASTDLNLTSILEPIFYEVPPYCLKMTMPSAVICVVLLH